MFDAYKCKFKKAFTEALVMALIDTRLLFLDIYLQNVFCNITNFVRIF